MRFLLGARRPPGLKAWPKSPFAPSVARARRKQSPAEQITPLLLRTPLQLLSGSRIIVAIPCTSPRTLSSFPTSNPEPHPRESCKTSRKYREHNPRILREARTSAYGRSPMKQTEESRDRCPETLRAPTVPRFFRMWNTPES